MTTKPTYKLNAYTLKIIAIIAMTSDHIGNVFEDQLPLIARMILFAPGGMTFPIMAFLLTEGYRHTHDVKKYGQRLLIFALVALIPFILVAELPMLNVLFTLLFGLIVIYLYDHMNNRVGFWFAFIGITLLTSFCDWPLMGVPMILCYHTIKTPVKRVALPLLFPLILTSLVLLVDINSGQTLLTLMPNILYTLIGCTATIPLLLNYNGERGKSMKYFFYTYYPAHLLILVVIRTLL
ncbi:fimbrial assembly protein fimC [Lactococcus hodotermopsidis]|uniref:Fimbrial assembly protein fimC n=1 Tax=Pseudolactococcus hodotermopsidis TaxID=2709157 RepID=A0A6A0B9T8_9LACT|nr:TraX family protein [Lactococcus hodotermopsidis]GFH41475.1 fimbrial assembly protein fimC [Lactococcus hodotermopsidis]